MPSNAAMYWGLGGALYAALCAVNILSKEEKDKTAEFLLAHPVRRTKIITEKLIAVLIQITALNLIIYALSVGSMSMIGEEIPWKEVNLLHFAYYLLQMELAGICFGISSFLRKRKCRCRAWHCGDDVLFESGS